MEAKLKKILELCLLEKDYESILKEVGNNDENKDWVLQIESIKSGIELYDDYNPPERIETNGEVIWLGGSFDAARNATAVRDAVKVFSSFQGMEAKEIVKIIVNSSWSSKCSFARWRKDPDSVDPYIRELFENA